jgi:hypothetical protein
MRMKHERMKFPCSSGMVSSTITIHTHDAYACLEKEKTNTTDASSVSDFLNCRVGLFEPSHVASGKPVAQKS